MGWWIDAPPSPPLTLPPGWLPSRPNGGWAYRDRITPAAAGMGVVAFYAGRYGHSSAEAWERRLAAGEISRNGVPLRADAVLVGGDRLVWQRPPWPEPAVLARWGVIHDDGDLLVIDKPSGLPVLPAGGFLEHTVLRLLERRHGDDPTGVPRPVHRLGRFTSGLLVCARRPATRAWLSAQLRESTGSLASGASGGVGVGGGGDQGGGVPPCRKLYRALLVPGRLELAAGDSLAITTPIGRRPHPPLGEIWCAAEAGDPAALAAHSQLTLLESGGEADLVEVAIVTGRPHQIRIHCAAVGAPLLGDPLYRPGGWARPGGLPGEGGYRLQARWLRLQRPDGSVLELEAPPAQDLATAAASQAG
ncbi:MULTISPECIES: pseudouridine synthase [unclassified Synechococcus]|uniref:pseudouridine synthase n=1 Tax=unclassified Synechococcus TaxID=2626047 RepID=UPI001C24558E|nr:MULTISPECIES: pseudouridine synthase [unclassified Synechococcus]